MKEIEKKNNKIRSSLLRIFSNIIFGELKEIEKENNKIRSSLLRIIFSNIIFGELKEIEKKKIIKFDLYF